MVLVGEVSDLNKRGDPVRDANVDVPVELQYRWPVPPLD